MPRVDIYYESPTNKMTLSKHHRTCFYKIKKKIISKYFPQVNASHLQSKRGGRGACTISKPHGKHSDTDKHIQSELIRVNMMLDSFYTAESRH